MTFVPTKMTVLDITDPEEEQAIYEKFFREHMYFPEDDSEDMPDDGEDDD